MTTITIGAPNSIARYVSETYFGENEYGVFEYVGGMPVLRAAGSKEMCERHMQPDRYLVHVKSMCQLRE